MNKKKHSRPKYSKEFKEQAIAKCLEIGINKTSKELGVTYVTLKKWVEKAEQNPTDKSKPSYEDLEKEVRRLKKEIGYINEINTILKKSTAIFSAKEMDDIE